MKTFIVKLAGLILLVFVAINISDSFFKEKNSYKKVLKGLNKIENIDILILGSSRAQSSYDPRIFEEELGVKTYNLGTPAQKFEATSVAASYALNKKHPKIAIVDIFVLSIGKYYVEKNKTDQLQTLNQIPFSIHKSKKVFEIFKKEGFVNAIFPTLQNHSAWNDVFFGDFSGNYTIGHGVDFYNGFISFNKSVDKKMWDKFLESQKGKNIYDHNVELTIEEKNKIDDIIVLLKSKDCLPIFVNSPTYYMDYDARNWKYSHKIGEYLKEKNSIYVDLNDWKDSLGLNRKHFSDPNHLNPKGAKITSNALTNYIKNNLYLKQGALPSSYRKYNRFYHIKNKLETANFKKNIQNTTGLQEKNILKIAAYNVTSDIAEVIIEVKDTNNINIPIKIIHETIAIRGKLNKVNLHTFANKFYLVFPFTLGKEKLDNVKIFVGNEENDPIMKIKGKTTI